MRNSFVSRLRKIPGAIVIGVMGLAPLPYGSVEYGWVCIWLGMLAACILVRIWIAPPPSRKAPLLIVGLLGLGLIALARFQVSTWVPPSLTSPAWQVAAQNGIADVAGRVAIEADTPINALAMPMAALLAFLAGYLFADRRTWCLTLIRALVVSGFLYALLGIIVGISNPGYVLFEKKIAYQTDFTGTFVNRNTAAAYFGVCLLAALTLAFRAWRENWPGGYLPPRERFLFLTQNFASASSFWTIATAALLVAVLLTGSRAGMACSLGVASVLFVLLIRKRGRIRRRAVILGMIIVVGCIVQLFGSGNILTRVTEGFDENGRYAAWSSSWDIVKDFPVFGTGLGTFISVFPAYRKSEHGIMQIWERAHNTPLELAVELGLPATILISALWASTCVILFRAYRREPNAYALPALGLAVLLLAGLHSLVDFPLQIPGCAIPVGIVSGALFRQSVNNSAPA